MKIKVSSPITLVSKFATWSRQKRIEILIYRDRIMSSQEWPFPQQWCKFVDAQTSSPICARLMGH